MTFFDDRRFLLSHIRHSFITCDDTGMCEMVMLNETMPHRSYNESYSSILDTIEIEAKSDLDASQSYDIVSEMEMIGAHRRRSNTAQRLEKLKQEKKIQSKVKVIQWNNDDVNLAEKNWPELIMPKSSEKVIERKPRKSALSAQIEKYPSMPNNAFNEYAKFDGRIYESSKTRRYTIFLTMLSNEKKSKPIEVVSLFIARVQDLIGLICWLYTNEGLEPRLKPSVNNYCLKIAEENGEVDPDFPSLNPKEPLEKFGFPVLALVESENDLNTMELKPLEPPFFTARPTEQAATIKSNSLDARKINQTDSAKKAKRFYFSVLKKLPWKGDSKCKKNSDR